MNRTDRLYALSEALRAAGPGGRNASWLAERFEVSTRTIKRDIAALVAAGAPIFSQDGRGGGYQLGRGEPLPPMSFTDGEALAMAIALAGDPWMPFSLDGRSALTKLMSAMTPAGRAEARALAKRVWMRSKGVAPRPIAARVLDEALRRSVVVLIDYVDGEGNLSSARPVEPMAFARITNHWYLLAFCHLRQAGRWFRLDRVRHAQLTRQPAPDRSLGEVFGDPPEDAQPVALDDLSAHRSGR